MFGATIGRAELGYDPEGGRGADQQIFPNTGAVAMNMLRRVCAMLL